MAALGVVSVVVGVVAVAASACHAVVTATENCTGLVTYTVTAWNGNPRSNNDVSVQANGTQLATGAFNSGNGYSFTGTYQARTAGQVTITASGLGQWYGTGQSSVNDTSATSVQVSPSGSCTQTTQPTTTTPTPPTTPRITTPTPTSTTPTHVTTTTPVTTPPPVTTAPAVTTPAPVTPAATSTVPVTPAATTPATTPATLTSGLSIVKTEHNHAAAGGFVSGPITVEVGDTVDYQIVVRNTGTATLTLRTVDSGCVIRGGSTLDLGGVSLAPGASLIYHCSHLISAGNRPTYTNTATANGVPASASASPVSGSSSVVATIPTVLAAHHVITHKIAKSHKKVAKPAAKKAVTKIAKTKVVKKVVAKAKPAKPVLKPASFTG